MITREHVTHFYDRYKENLRKEERVSAQLMQADSQEEWVENLKQKYRVMRELYIENEAMLDLYVRPFLEEREELTPEVAETFTDQIWLAKEEGFDDQLAMMEMSEFLKDYFHKNGPLEYEIWNLSLLGIFYNCSSEQEDGRKGYEYFTDICKMRAHYFSIPDFQVRKRIIYAFYNRCILQVNFRLDEEETLRQNLDEALEFLQNPKVRALDGENFDFEGLIQELNYDTFGNYLISHTRENAMPWALERARDVLGMYYRQELEKNPNPYAMPDEIYGYYKQAQFFLGELSCTEFLDDYKCYCDYSLAHDKLEHPEGFWESRLFQVTVNHLPKILQCLNLYGEEYHGDPTLRGKCVEAYLSVIRQLPRTGNTRFVNDVVRRSLNGFMQLLTLGDVESEILINVMMNRDEITLIHSRMVAQIAERILDSVLAYRPDLLIGTFECKNVLEVLEKREGIMAFVSLAGKIFDVGKLKDADIVNKQSRQLTQNELHRIYRHSEAGARMVKKIKSLNRLHDVVLGHHKSWDGTMGYPESFNPVASPDRFLIELIHVSDSIDAATDFIGRSYKDVKTFEECLEELEQGAGTLYAPELIGLIRKDTQLIEDLNQLLNEGRIQTYYEVYGIVVKDEVQKPIQVSQELKNDLEQDEKGRLINILHESSKENYNFVHAMVRNSLMTLFVDLRNGKYHVFSRGEQRLFSELPDGKYHDFVVQYLKKIACPQDWDKIKYQLTLPELIHMLSGRSGNFECTVRLKVKATYRWVRISFLKTDEQNVIPRSMAVIFTDVQESYSRSEQMQEVLKEAYQTAIEASQAKSLFLSCMSHDIRTPMNGIIGMTQIALQHLDEKERVADCLRKIDLSSRQLMEMINEVLDMSGIESGKTTLHEEPVRLQDVIEDSIDVCRPSLLEANQTLTVDIERLGTDWVVADQVRLRQIFTNILSNAVKYTPEKGHILIRAREAVETKNNRKCYQFEFKDDGIGMSEEFQKKLYEPFSREDNSMTSSKEGTGLGLSIVKSMLNMMGGTIEVKSRQGEGTAFKITLAFPVIKKQKPKEEQEAGKQRFDGYRILLVEDNQLNREIACELLENIGLTVETAKNGSEALKQFQQMGEGYYALILMDIQMPVMNGYEATRAIRDLGGAYAAQIPIIALTANIFQDDILHAIESGMNEHITKPIDMKKVTVLLNRWLKKSDSN